MVFGLCSMKCPTPLSASCSIPGCGVPDANDRGAALIPEPSMAGKAPGDATEPAALPAVEPRPPPPAATADELGAKAALTAPNPCAPPYAIDPPSTPCLRMFPKLPPCWMPRPSAEPAAPSPAAASGPTPGIRNDSGAMFFSALPAKSRLCLTNWLRMLTGVSGVSGGGGLRLPDEVDVLKRGNHVIDGVSGPGRQQLTEGSNGAIEPDLTRSTRSADGDGKPVEDGGSINRHECGIHRDRRSAEN